MHLSPAKGIFTQVVFCAKLKLEVCQQLFGCMPKLNAGEQLRCNDQKNHMPRIAFYCTSTPTDIVKAIATLPC